MPVSGRYDFPGIKKAGAAALKAALATTPWGQAILRGPFGKLPDLLFEFVVNWFANKGLIFLNIAAIEIGTAFDQKQFDKALSEGLAKIEVGRGILTQEQLDAIDQEVIKAFRKFAPFS